MKLITMKFTVMVDDKPVSDSGEKIPLDEITKDLYDHICLWDFNVHGTVEVEEESITDI